MLGVVQLGKFWENELLAASLSKPTMMFELGMERKQHISSHQGAIFKYSHMHSVFTIHSLAMLI
jgi:hypothetical protein